MRRINVTYRKPMYFQGVGVCDYHYKNKRCTHGENQSQISRCFSFVQNPNEDRTEKTKLQVQCKIPSPFKTLSKKIIDICQTKFKNQVWFHISCETKIENLMGIHTEKIQPPITITSLTLYHGLVTIRSYV
jgi:hypothetical protein